MGLRYRKSINLGGGFRINFSKSGIGYSWGTKGYRVTKTARGTTRRTYSIPGTGLSYTKESGRSNSRRNAPSRRQRNNTPTRQPDNNYRQQLLTPSYETTREIESGNVLQFQTAEADNIVASIHRTIALNSWGTLLIWCIILMAYQPAFIILPIAGIIMKILAHTVAVVDLEYSFDAEAEERNAYYIAG